MAYVDLNPIRAGIAETPEESAYTSIKERIQQAMTNTHNDLLPFQDECNDKNSSSIPFTRNDYISLIDWSGRAILPDKTGHISEAHPPILVRLGIDENDWLNHIRYFERQFPTVAGSIEKLKELARKTQRRWIKGMSQAFTPQIV